MKRNRNFVLALVLVVLASFAGRALPAHACICYAPTVNTSIYQGTANNCTKATNRAYNHAYDEAVATCISVNAGSVCGEQFTVTSACAWDAGLGAYAVSGQLYYNCLSCGNFCSVNGDCPFGYTCVGGACQ